MATRSTWSRVERYYRRKAASLLFTTPLLVKPQQPLISFTFDDFPRSALLAGGAILRRFGAVGTYYAAFGLLGKDTPTGQIFVAEDLSVLFEQEHELGCHTFSHCDSWDTAPDVFEQAIAENRAALQRLFPGAEFKSFSYPISMPRPLSKAKASDHFLSCRGGGQTLNAGKADRSQLAAYFLEKSRDNLQAVKDLIDRNREARGWIIFATHDIAENPTPYGCTPEFFEQVVQYAAQSSAQIVPVIKALDVLGVPGSQQVTERPSVRNPLVASVAQVQARKPLVSILIPAFNAQEWIADTIRSAIGQTWQAKEIIVVDDGSTDATLTIARRFESEGVGVVSQANQGGAAARNRAFSLSRGEYIQWLDADDLLAPDKIERQMERIDASRSKRIALSSAFGTFRYRWYRADFTPTELWADLSPMEWLRFKMGQNLYMQTATWLVSRELAEAAGPWDTRMLSDDDGEYFCRVLLNSEGVRFVPDAKVYYRAFRYDGLSHVGKSSRKIDALWLSMKLHIDYLRSLEDSPQTRKACIAYLQRNMIHFVPNSSEIAREAERLAESLGGKLRAPYLSWKYSWMKALFGWGLAKNASLYLRKVRWATQKYWDKMVFVLGNRRLDLDIPTLEPDLARVKSTPKERSLVQG